MKKRFFIMMNFQRGNPAPIQDSECDDDSVAFYDTEEEAREVAENHTFCKMWGYEIFERGTGS